MVDFDKINAQSPEERKQAAVARMEEAANVIKKQQKMIADCVNNEEYLTDWERKFIDSISVQSANGRFLSQKQEAMLDRIHGNVADSAADDGKELS